MSQTRQRVGIITGLMEEADAFRPGTGAIEGDCPFYCRHGEDFAVACAGIGKVNAAMAASWLIMNGCVLLVSMGVAGRIAAGPRGAHWLTEALQHDYGAERSDGFARFRAGSLPFGPPRLDPYRAIPDPGLNLPQCRILTGDRFIENRDYALKLGALLDAELIDMETGAVAQVATMHGLPWAGVRSVSDEVDHDSVDQFEANLMAAAREAAQAVDRLIPLLAQQEIMTDSSARRA
ncbi:5'-methylthioadenosine/S-adenosylhomocysteine nucleosidase [Sphingomicrobium nitratireducens]|uniref:5'-methylthioadenosine/S-adenosylhomocysteine nucleosidase n=1 Tax=Sphingomicrobium nitratireducens TaxID=2964666 RepID=UPI002240988E